MMVPASFLTVGFTSRRHSRSRSAAPANSDDPVLLRGGSLLVRAGYNTSMDDRVRPLFFAAD